MATKEYEDQEKKEIIGHRPSDTDRYWFDRMRRDKFVVGMDGYEQ